MRTSSAVLFGKPRLLCFSTGVMLSCADRFGSVQGLFDAMSDNDDRAHLEAMLWIAEQMMAAGERYANRFGLEPCETITAEEMLDVCGIDDIPALKSAILATVVADTDRTQEAEPPKNAEATPTGP